MQSNFQQKVQSSPDPNKYPEIVRILIFVGLFQGVNFVWSFPNTFIWAKLNEIFLPNLDPYSIAYFVVSLVISRMISYGLCIIKGLLYRRLVFRSKFNAFLPILVMCGLNDVSSFIRTLIGMVVNANALTGQQYTAILNTMSIVSLITVATVGYVIMRCGFYKRTLDTLVKRDEPAPAEDLPCDAEEGV